MTGYTMSGSASGASKALNAPFCLTAQCVDGIHRAAPGI